jgi:hypothetical protein
MTTYCKFTLVNINKKRNIIFVSPYHVFKLCIYFMILSHLTQQLVYEMHVCSSLFVHVLMQVNFGRRHVVEEQVKVKGSTSNEGFKVELPDLVCTFVLHECGENRKK